MKPITAYPAYDGSLRGLFTLLEACCEEHREVPSCIPRSLEWRSSERRSNERRSSERRQPELFPDSDAPANPASAGDEDRFRAYHDALLLPCAAELSTCSPQARDGFVHGWMSERPIEAELLRYARRVIMAARTAPPGAGRRRAEQAALDRGDPAARTVLEAASQVTQEIHRLMGFLRFSPDSRGIYRARCEPDYFTLPALAFHFSRRFGGTPWEIRDARRRLSLAQLPDGGIRLTPLPPVQDEEPADDPADDPAEALWRKYHRALNNESRSNPALQRQFMPRRYWKYLPELE